MIAILILAHKSPNQLARLVDIISSNQIVFYIHIDKKSNKKLFEKALKKLKLNNIHFVKQHSVNWGTLSQTNARLELLKEALHDKQNYTHYLMLSGQTYPIKPINELLDLLRKNEGVSFMEHYKLPYDKLSNGGLDRINCFTFRLRNKLVTYLPKNYQNTFSRKGKILNYLLYILILLKGKRKKPKNVNFYYGIDWWILANSAVIYLLDYIDKNPSYHKYHKYTRHACEVYFPTILCGTNYNGEIINDSLHFMKWENNGSGNTCVLKLEDLADLLNSNKFFARKFDEKIDKKVLDLINKELL